MLSVNRDIFISSFPIYVLLYPSDYVLTYLTG